MPLAPWPANRSLHRIPHCEAVSSPCPHPSAPLQATGNSGLLLRRLGALPPQERMRAELELLLTTFRQLDGAPAAPVAAAAAAAGPDADGWRRLGRHLVRRIGWQFWRGLYPRRPLGGVRHEYGADAVALLQAFARELLGCDWPGGRSSREAAAETQRRLCFFQHLLGAAAQWFRSHTQGLPHLPCPLPMRLPARLWEPPLDAAAFTADDLATHIEHPLGQLQAERDGYHRREGMGIMDA